MYKPSHVTNYRLSDFDNFKFLIHELFLYTVCIFLKYEHFQQANQFFEEQYYSSKENAPGSGEMKNFTVFREYLEALEHRKKRLSLGRVSLRADFLKNRCTG